MAKDIGMYENLFGCNLKAWIDEAYCFTPNIMTIRMGVLILKNH